MTQAPVGDPGQHPEVELYVLYLDGNPAGMALAYDKYAAALYGYCHWLLHDSAGAAESLRRQDSIEWMHVRHEEVAAFAAAS